MDGQLGVNGENSAMPCLLKQFLELGHPDSLTDESGVERKTSLKVLKVLKNFIICHRRHTW